MPRITDDDVKEIIETALDTRPFILTANLLVTTYLGATTLPEAQLAEIERWWTAHLVTIREPRPHRVQLGESLIEHVEGDLGQGLASSFYGQTVLQLDTSGTLRDVTVAAAEALRPASFPPVLRT
jgi:hypothetical protein